MSKWHELIADTIRLMPAGEPVDSERNRELAKRYLELDMEQDTARAEQNFILMENIAPHAGGDGSFDELRASGVRPSGKPSSPPTVPAPIRPNRLRSRAVRVPQSLISPTSFGSPHGTSYPRSVSASMAPPKGSATRKDTPMLVSWMTTNKCNLKCVHCCQGRRGGH
ncbi:MAG: hypothetical protein ACLTMP_04350 [Eggerthella lenta]